MAVPICQLSTANRKDLCLEGSNCQLSENPLFLDYKAVLANTEEALPACMAMHGPQFKSDLQGQGYGLLGKCDQMFETSISEPDTNEIDKHYLKWSDVKCNQKTRAQICTILGKKIRSKRIL